MPQEDRPFTLKAPFEPSGQQPQAIASLVQGVEDGLAAQTLLGVTGSGKTFMSAHVIAETQRPALVMAPNKTLAAQLYAELRDFFPDNAVEYFVSYYDYYQPEAYVPSTDTFIEKDAAVNAQIEQMRLSATKAMLQRRDCIVVATVSAIYGLGDPSTYLDMVLRLQCGERMDQRAMLRKLAGMQYKRNQTELQRSSYQVRGDVIDIFPSDSEKEAVRIHVFDDEIERIQLFDPLTQSILEEKQGITIFPKSHYVTPKARLEDAAEQIKVELTERLGELKEANKLVAFERLDTRVNMDLEMMQELGYCSGIENYSRYLSGRAPGEPPPCLFDYLPDDALLFVDESHVTLPQIGGMYRGDRARKENLVQFGFRLPSALDNRPLRFDEFEKMMPQSVFISATPAQYEAEHSSNAVECVVRPTGLLDPETEVRPVADQVDDVLSEIHARVKLGDRVLITTLTKRMSEDLTAYLHDQSIKVRYVHSDIDTVERVEILRDLRLGVFDVLVGINLLREGLDIPEVSLVAIFDADKEGFLRSERALIQTIGRAARHVRGKAILYADKITRSMKAALDETERRRAVQQAYNQAHGITPQSIQKKVCDLLEADETEAQKQHYVEVDADRTPVLVDALTPKEAGKLLEKMEQTMLQHAEQLEFEEAGRIRDAMLEIKKKVF